MRVFGFVAMLVLWAASATAQNDDQRFALSEALAAAGAREWVKVDALQPTLESASARDLVEWMRLRGRQGTFAECRDFVERNGDWPGMKLLRQRCEYSIPRGADADNVLSFFDGWQPQSGTGSLRLAGAYYAKDRETEAVAELRRGWLTFNLSAGEHDAFVSRNAEAIKDLHTERLDAVLWRGASNAAHRMYPLVSEDWRALAEARIGLRARVPGVDNLVEAVPEALKSDPGLAFERFSWRSSKGRDDALDLLLANSASEETLGQPERWARPRRSIARGLMRAVDPSQAYAVASQHYLTEGSDFADLEWLSGFLALRKLDSPAQAITHFEAFRDAVETPISLGRAGYWLGRAYEAAGDKEKARDAYAFGAKYQSSFYGQLAAERGNTATDPTMAGTEIFPDWREAAFTKSSVFQAANELLDAGHADLAERFFVHLAETQSRTELGQLGDFVTELEEPHIALKVAKQAARMGFELYKTYYPLGPPMGQEVPVPMELALSIARRESEFDPIVVSPAGARGLMQLMPGTAQEVAGQLGLEYSRTRLISDPDYNARLGAQYLAGLAKRFDNNPVLMSIGYNAGPSRARRWPELYGDPRSPDVDVIDWIEGIPFRETRNYVMRVTESFAPYRARLSGEVAPLILSKELKR